MTNMKENEISAMVIGCVKSLPIVISGAIESRCQLGRDDCSLSSAALRVFAFSALKGPPENRRDMSGLPPVTQEMR